MIVPLTAACISAAALSYGVSEPALWMILKTESGRVGACTVQSNGSHDCGPAQINAETWTLHFAQLLHRPVDEMFYAIRDNGCFNITAAAYILRLKVEEARGDVWDGIGRYNSATPALKHAYQQRIADAYRRLYPQSQR
ncbi:MAG TPA: lytic transglycosylase domain-containing protein [Stellaceae bacterium]|nr:lytic transglycosylase domain-containing protein [Stellaceae bacterium]